jgi:hypothetical protein
MRFEGTGADNCQRAEWKGNEVVDKEDERCCGRVESAKY